jgi:hypothetical protein
MRTRTFHAGWPLILLGLAVPAFAMVPARPGTINYTEGRVFIDGKLVTTDSDPANLRSGSILRTEAGRAEMLLTPGVFLRLGNNSEAQLTSASLTDLRVNVSRGVAMVEATNVQKENRIEISDSSLNGTLKKNGLYRFDADHSTLAVFDGEADVRQGDKAVEVKKGKEAVTGDTGLKVEKFDTKAAKETDELYKWSSLRSKYLSQASEATAQQIIVQPGGWYGSGWYWNPWFRSYTWLPGGDPFFSPFGYGFYSPWRPYRPIIVVPRYPRVGPRFYSTPGHFRGGARRVR